MFVLLFYYCYKVKAAYTWPSFLQYWHLYKVCHLPNAKHTFSEENWVHMTSAHIWFTNTNAQCTNCWWFCLGRVPWSREERKEKVSGGLKQKTLRNKHDKSAQWRTVNQMWRYLTNHFDNDGDQNQQQIGRSSFDYLH